jgi:hypothetical protein
VLQPPQAEGFAAKAREAAFGLDKLGVTGSSPVPPIQRRPCKQGLCFGVRLPPCDSDTRKTHERPFGTSRGSVPPVVGAYACATFARGRGDRAVRSRQHPETTTRGVRPQGAAARKEIAQFVGKVRERGMTLVPAPLTGRTAARRSGSGPRAAKRSATRAASSRSARRNGRSSARPSGAAACGGVASRGQLPEEMRCVRSCS